MGWVAAWRAAQAAEQRVAVVPDAAHEACAAWEAIVSRADFSRAGRSAQVSALAAAASAHLRLLSAGDGAPDHLDRALELVAAACAAGGGAHPLVLYVQSLSRLARFERSGETEDLAEAVAAAERALAVLPRRGRQARILRPQVQYAYARAAHLQAVRTRQREAFDFAASLLTEAIDASAQAPPLERWTFAAELAQLLVQRFGLFGAPSDLDEAIALTGVLLEQPAIPEPLRLPVHVGHADALRMRYEDSGSDEDLERSIAMLEPAIAEAADSPAAVAVRGNLAMALIARYRRSNNQEDLERALAAVTDASGGQTFAGGQSAALLNQEARIRLLLFDRAGDRDQLERALRAADEAVARLPGDDVLRPSALLTQSDALLARFQLDADEAFLAAARTACVEVLQLVPEGGLLRDGALRGLALLAQLRGINGDAEAIEEAVERADQALSLDEQDTASVIALAQALRIRYLATGDSDDLQRLLGLLEDHRERPGLSPLDGPAVLAGICDGMLLRYYESSDPDDIARAVHAGEEALRLTAPDSPNRSALAAGVAAALAERRAHQAREGARVGMVEELDREVQLFETALREMGPRSRWLASFERSLALLLAERAQAQANGSDLEHAIELLAKARSHATSPFETLQILNNTASLYWQRFQHSHDLRDGVNAVDLWEQAINTSAEAFVAAPVSHRLGQHRQWTKLYARLVEALVELAKTDPEGRPQFLRRAMAAAEAGKSRLIADVLSRAPIPTPDHVDRALIDRERELAATLAALDRAELASIGAATVNSEGAHLASDGTRLAAARHRSELLAELSDIWTQLATTGDFGASYVTLRRGLPATWDDLNALAESVGPATLLASLFLAETRTLLFMLQAGHNEPTLVERPIDYDGWDLILERFFSEVHDYKGKSNRENWQQDLVGLLAEANPHLAGAERVVLAAESAGHLIPWPALAQQAGWTTTSGDPIAVATVPALNTLAHLRRRPPPETSEALVVGNPLGDLDYAEQEATEIAQRLQTTPLIGPDATKQSVLDGLRRSRVAHLATHAFFTAGSPLDSGIWLADATISAREAMTANLDADLIVLSACQTGITGRLGGDETAGFTQALLVAGARSMIVSLWEVNDPATAALMRDFYDNRANGFDKAAALARAIAHLRTQPNWSHSYYCAAFTLVGDWQ